MSAKLPAQMTEPCLGLHFLPQGSASGTSVSGKLKTSGSSLEQILGHFAANARVPPVTNDQTRVTPGGLAAQPL